MNNIRFRSKTPCPVCGEFPARRQITCGDSCLRIYLSEKRAKKVRENLGKGILNPRLIKKYLLEIHGHICSVCLRVKWRGKPIPLVLDHVNGRANDDHYINLRLVCGNCDMQLDTYKSKNKISDRRYLRKNGGCVNGDKRS